MNLNTITENLLCEISLELTKLLDYYNKEIIKSEFDIEKMITTPNDARNQLLTAIVLTAKRIHSSIVRDILYSESNLQ